MNKNILYGIVGFAFGGLAGTLITNYILRKEYEAYEAIVEEGIEEMKRYYEQRYAEKELRLYGKEDISASEIEVIPADIEDMEEVESYTDHSIRYSKIYPPKEDHIKKTRDEEEAGVEEKEDTSEIDAINAWVEDHENRPPEIITEEEAGELPPHIEHVCWKAWSEDHLITDENDEVVEDSGRFLGGCMDDWWFDSLDDYMFVINYEYNTVYEIEHVFGSMDQR